MKKLTVGELRQQGALVDAKTRVILVVDDELRRMLNGREIILTAAYPDLSHDGSWFPSFKIDATLQ